MKLQHPALAEWIPLDMSLTKFSFKYIKWFFPEYPMTWLSDEMEASYVCLDSSHFLNSRSLMNYIVVYPRNSISKRRPRIFIG